MKRILFFAFKEDLLPMLVLAENRGKLKYVRMGNFVNREIESHTGVFDRSADIPNLGKANADSSAACEAFLVCEESSSINLRRVQANNGERVCIDQLENPDSVEFRPGGIWNDDVVLYGRIATASESPISHALMKRFQAAVKTTFVKVKSYYVGSKALEFLRAGKRLTISAQSPREFDLTQ